MQNAMHVIRADFPQAKKERALMSAFRVLWESIPEPMALILVNHVFYAHLERNAEVLSVKREEPLNRRGA